MSSLFEDLCQGLNEAIEIEKGSLKGKETVLEIEPVRKFSGKEVKRIRNQQGMTQKVFAMCLGVSPKTIEAWECDRNEPSGSACRLMMLLDDGKIKTSIFS